MSTTSRYQNYANLAFDRPADRVLRITLNKPERLNALDSDGHRELAAALLLSAWFGRRGRGDLAKPLLTVGFSIGVLFSGIAAVKVGDLYQFLPVAEAKTRAIPSRSIASPRSRGAEKPSVAATLARPMASEAPAASFAQYATAAARQASAPSAQAL